MDPPSHDDEQCWAGDDFIRPGSKDTQVQLVISLALGLSAFLAFCFLRPRWTALYAARKRNLDPLTSLPSLPDTFLGWIPALYRITEEQVLASAGLDAFVFLTFFNMAMRLFAIMFIFAAVILEPINRHYNPKARPLQPANTSPSMIVYDIEEDVLAHNDDDQWVYPGTEYLWSYVAITYFFTLLTIYTTNVETHRVIRIRQEYLGTQSTVTDRTFRISRIPHGLRTETKIKDLVQKLEIGKVESVALCRDWQELDDAMAERDVILRKLEEAWAVHMSHRSMPKGGAEGDSTEPAEQDRSAEMAEEEEGESSRLLGALSSSRHFERKRPQVRIWYGTLGLQSRKTDAIDYYEEMLRRLDERIRALRRKPFKPTDLAFVSMDSISACQMAIQALIDPRPGRLLTKPAPAPSDIVWRSTYSPRLKRFANRWTITTIVGLLSVIWLIPVAFFASVLNLCTIGKLFPSLADSLRRHNITKALVQTGLPTAVVSLLNVAVPYLYEYLSYNQGMLSRGDVALAIISKNFFFTFFNIFLVFTLFGTATQILPILKDSLRDTTKIAYTLAQQIESLSVFYLNFIMLQGIGLFPFRLLEFGNVSLYPVYRMGAKTPRDFAELNTPPTFNYGLYLPTALLVFILCQVYSALPRGYLVLLLGVIFFALGHFSYKYQLLYAMDQPQHATGGAWRMICYRIILGLVIAEITMSGTLALKKAFAQAALVLPLLFVTVWYGYYYRRRFVPLMRFISLRSIKREEHADDENAVSDEESDDLEGRRQGRWRRGSTVDEDRDRGHKFVNPSLVSPLAQPWIYRNRPLCPSSTRGGVNSGCESGTPGSGSRSNTGESSPNQGRVSSNPSVISLGDTHIWRGMRSE